MSVIKTIAVVGATGATAGGLARAILSDPEGGYACRAITRDPESAAARALSEQGATVVRADLDDYDSLVRAFYGAYGAFCMTNFFVHFSAEQEAEQAANQARAAAVAGVRHAIWSTAEDTRRWYSVEDHTLPTLHGGYKVPNWDGKGAGDRFFAAAGVPTTYLLTPFHWEAFVFGLGAPQPGPDGVRTLAIPLGEARLPGIPPKTSAAAPTPSSRTRHGSWARRSASRVSTRPATSWPRGSRTCSASRCATSMCRLRSSVNFRSPAPTSPRTCSNSLPRTTATARAAMSHSPGH